MELLMEELWKETPKFTNVEREDGFCCFCWEVGDKPVSRGREVVFESEEERNSFEIEQFAQPECWEPGVDWLLATDLLFWTRFMGEEKKGDLDGKFL